MPILQLQFKDNIIGKYRLKSGKAVTIGRHDSNDIVIENVSVSGEHAKVNAGETDYRLTDLNSTNGTFVNDTIISAHTLEHGDVISIGKHKLIFGYVKGEKRPQKAAASEENNLPESTMVLETEEHRRMLASNVANRSSETSKLAILSFLSGGEGEIVLKKKLIKIGKDPTNDVVIAGLTVGKTAATISRMPNGYQLSYIGGITKPKVNDVAVKESVKLEEFDTIEIGSTKFKFVFND